MIDSKDFPCISGGALTPKAIASYLRKHGHLECIIDNRRYITYKGAGYQIIYAADEAVQVIQIPMEDCITLGKHYGIIKETTT